MDNQIRRDLYTIKKSLAAIESLLQRLPEIPSRGVHDHARRTRCCPHGRETLYRSLGNSRAYGAVNPICLLGVSGDFSTDVRRKFS